MPNSKVGIYAIQNVVNGAVYIGRALDLEKRKRRHFVMLNAGKHHSVKLQQAYTRHGPGRFVAKTLIFCDAKHLEFYEQRFIDGFDSYRYGYNGCPVSGAPMAGRKETAEHHAKISEASIGRVKSAETRRLLSVASSRKHSPARIELNRSVQQRPEVRAAVSARMVGNKNALGSVRSDAARAKYVACWTPERRAALAEQMRKNNPNPRAKKTVSPT